jgi:hypothetical protein
MRFRLRSDYKYVHAMCLVSSCARGRAAQSTMAPQPPVLFVVVNYKQQVAPFPLISSHPKLGRGVG